MNERFKHAGNGEENANEYNSRVGENFGVLKSLLRRYFDQKLRFEKRVAFGLIGKKEQVKKLKLQRELAEIKQNTRELFLLDSKNILNDVCKKNFNEYMNLNLAYSLAQPYTFSHYIQYSLPSEGVVMAGAESLSAITIRLVEPKGSEDAGDEMHIRFATSDELILDDATGEEDVEDWYESIDEVYVEYDKKTDIGFKTEVFALSGKTFRSFPGVDFFTDEDYETLKDTDKLQTIGEKEADRLKELYQKLGTMKISPYKTTNVGP